MRRPQRHTEGENPGRTCKLPAGGVVLLVLVGLLAAAVIIYKLSFDKIRTNQTIQTLKEENEALRKNISEQQTCPTCPTCPPPPPPPAVKRETFLKCEAGWEKHGGNCYYFNINKSSWNDSRRFCQHHGSDLVKIDSREEQMFLQSKLKKDRDSFWIGLTDSQTEGKWFWVDGSPLDPSLSFWHNIEPNNSAGKNPAGEDCGRMEKRENNKDLNNWDDYSCDVQIKSVCEKPAEM
ncbi:CD209 antigen-like protein E isoform X3 [Xiphophorus hellerii]|uniref:CD209 antigen-like protein E isoform X3 n=1 Tax=Xiphophorus hellerii TaxID=8084 RepID=UPI0013B38D11|nr:CD209 antigen-like protein E isoform X3 [Xiphophorus hellerii]